MTEVSTVLNIGCGNDRMNDAVNLDRYREPTIHCFDPVLLDVQSDAHHLPFKQDVFGKVVASQVLEHCKAPVTVLKEIRRVLVPGGEVYLEVPNPRHVGEEQSKGHEGHIYSWTKGSLIRLMKFAGFRDVEYSEQHPDRRWDKAQSVEARSP